MLLQDLKGNILELDVETAKICHAVSVPKDAVSTLLSDYNPHVPFRHCTRLEGTYIRFKDTYVLVDSNSVIPLELKFIDTATGFTYGKGEVLYSVDTKEGISNLPDYTSVEVCMESDVFVVLDRWGSVWQLYKRHLPEEKSKCIYLSFDTFHVVIDSKGDIDIVSGIPVNVYPILPLTAPLGEEVFLYESDLCKVYSVKNYYGFKVVFKHSAKTYKIYYQDADKSLIKEENITGSLRYVKDLINA